MNKHGDNDEELQARTHESNNSNKSADCNE